jgi:hypothetical protein
VSEPHALVEIANGQHSGIAGERIGRRLHNNPRADNVEARRPRGWYTRGCLHGNERNRLLNWLDGFARLAQVGLLLLVE